MQKITITESDMQFGEYNSTNFFHIEKSKQYCERLMNNGIKTCEFILKRNNQILFLEAKKSCPNFNNCRESEDKLQKYNKYIDDISDKLKSSLQIYANILLSRYSQDNLSKELNKTNLNQVELIFVVVVKNTEMDWLKHYAEKVSSVLNQEKKIWKIKDVIFINEDVARRKQLIQ